MNYGAGPSRSPPIPYDDPYSDSFTSVSADGAGDDSMISENARNNIGRHDSIRPVHMNQDGNDTSFHATDRNLNPGLRHFNSRGRGRGGGRDRQSDKGRRGRGKGTLQHSHRHQTFPQQSGSHDHSGLIPPSGFPHTSNHQRGHGGGGEWNYSTPLVTPQPPVFGFGLQNTFSGVQPHINPKFANQLGFNFSQIPQMPQIQPGMGSRPSSEQYDPSDTRLQTATHHHQWEEGE